MDYTDFLIQKGYLPKDYGTVLTNVINAPVSNGGKTFSVGGKSYTWKGGVLYDAQGKKLGNVQETNNNVDLGKNLLTAMGYKGELFGETPQAAEKQAVDLGYTGETQYQDRSQFQTVTSEGQKEGFTVAGGKDENSSVVGVSPQVGAIIQGRSDLKKLYDLATGKAKNINAPKVQGIPTLADWWNQYGKKEYPNLVEDQYPNISDEIKNSEEWKQASEQDKLLTSMTVNAQTAIKAGDVALAQDLQDAIDKALKAADPYFKQKILMAQDEIKNTISSISGDYEYQKGNLESKIKNIKEDLIYNKEQLSIEQQAELSNMLKDYQNKLYDTQQQMAEAGLAFSSPRARAEQNLLTNYQGVSESTKRKYARDIRDQEITAQRQQEELQRNLLEAERQKKEKTTSTVRKGEEYLGTAGLPTDTGGITPLGGIEGALAYEKQKDVSSLAEKYNDWSKLI